MLRTLLARLAVFVPSLIFASVVVFSLVFLIPGGAASNILGPEATPEQIEALEKQLGLDKPAVEQYLNWAARTLTGDLGQSYINQAPIAEQLLVRMPVTFELTLWALLFALVIGVLWGLVAGYVGGWVDQVLSRMADVFLAFPSVVLSIAISTILGGTLPVTMVAVGFALSPSVARLMRSGAIVVRDREYVEASRMYGYGLWHRMVRHVFPNAFLPVMVQLTIFAGITLLAQTGLGFLGIGVQPPEASWGSSLGESFRYMNYNIWMTVIPGVVVVCTVISLYAVGDRIRDRFAAVAQS